MLGADKKKKKTQKYNNKQKNKQTNKQKKKKKKKIKNYATALFVAQAGAYPEAFYNLPNYDTLQPSMYEPAHEIMVLIALASSLARAFAVRVHKIWK